MNIISDHKFKELNLKKRKKNNALIGANSRSSANRPSEMGRGSAKFGPGGKDRNVSSGAATWRVGQDSMLFEERRSVKEDQAVDFVEH